MSQAAFLPWQTDLATQWLSNKERFAHAWLIHGLTGIGKREFALAAASALLCESPNNSLACGNCLACGWVALGNHPDLKRIRPESVAAEEGVAQATDAGLDDIGEAVETGSASKRAPSKEIRVEQIRSLETWFNTGTHRSGYRVVLIYPAESLNAITANTLLKVLEEPAPNTVFLLVADAPDRLLATLLSRCRRLPLATPSRAVALAWLTKQGVKAGEQWLAAAGGAPLLAKRLSEQRPEPCPQWLTGMMETLAAHRSLDVSPLADALAKMAASEWIDSLQRLCVDLLMAANNLPTRYFPGLDPSVTTIAANADVSALSDLSSWIGQQRRLANHPLNAKLFAQSMIQRVAVACRPSKFPKSPYVR
ncbi:DNA polymerase III delta prime subunit [Jezberella montanilacus]|uniref:DNA polymerase III delta prime subunit n=1 Tax=Jezberella montanilacus TaxID=323426 RepID=A0A2T0XJ15_9BURK|nr:DNA polymerase III subunit delta' [Jezberella montanilacus]PRY98938.1 DNA polymerase III delta prime subunit [Jezberella montanilacus]